MSRHFLEALQYSFARHSGRPALIQGDRTFTYGDVETRAGNVAGHLQALGIAKGDRVALWTADKLAFLAGHLGTLLAGGISLPLNPRYTREELRFFLQDSQARVVIAGPEQQRQLEALQQEFPGLGMVVPDKVIWELPASTYKVLSVAADDPCLLIYSSGTTGWPKGIVHTHANVASGLNALKESWRFAPEDVVINVLPLFHVHGLAFATLVPLLAGACVWLDDFQPQQTLRRIGQGTVFMAVPTIYYRFLELPEFRGAAAGWRNLRLCTCGSAPIRPEVLPELENILGRPVINRYGMTEAFVITSLPLAGPWPAGSVGQPLAGIEVRVIRADGNCAAPDEVGAVQLRGPNLFRRYWNNPDATQAAFSAGWFDTGDLGLVDQAGFLSLVGRKNDLIITNGYNVYPQVVERVINGCPGVGESAVVGVPDARRGERVAAAIVRLDPTLDEIRLRDFLSERLVDYQRPLTFVFLDNLPRNTMGKVLRRELREKLSQAGPS